MPKLRFAVKEDEDRIISFLKEHWSENSILVTSQKVFRYQYMMMADCGFVLAEDEETGEICGLKGYIPLNASEQPDIAAALAIVLKGSRPMLNMEIQRFLEKNTNCRMMCSTGLNPNTAARVYPLFRYNVSKLNQYYRLGDFPEYKIASVENKVIPPVAKDGLKLELLSSFTELSERFDARAYTDNMPYKDFKYIKYRYYDHPVYHYDVYGASGDNGSVSSLLIARKIDCNGRTALRIVDFIGRRLDLPLLGSAIDYLIRSCGCEYADFYCHGLPHENLTAAGFILRDEADPNIIPNYFEPFVQKNVDIWFFNNKHENYLVCKSDGDQDRPSVLPTEKM